MDETKGTIEPIKLTKILGTDNLLDIISEDDAGQLLSEIQNEAKEDTEAYHDRVKECEQILAISKTQKDEPIKNFPWDNASNVKYPLILSESNSIAAMLSTAILQDDIVKGQVIGSDEIKLINEQTQEGVEMKPLGKADKAERVATYTNYLLKHRIDEWEASMDFMFNRLALLGAQFKKVYFCPIEKQVKSELIDNKNMIVSDAVTLETADRKIHLFPLSKSEIISRQRAGIYTDKLNLDDIDADEKSEIHEEHLFYDLDGDGYEEPYIATYIKDGQFLSFTKRFDEEMVQFNDKKEVVSIEAIEYFVKYPFIKDADSSIYDIGFGQLLMPLNKTINTLINQLIDAGTLANTSGGVISGGSGIRSGNSLKIKMGEYKVLNDVTDIKNNIMEISGKEPSQTLFALLGTLTGAAKEITSIKNINPDNIGANTPATTTLYMVEQGLNEFKAIYKRIHRALTKEIEKILFFQNKYGETVDYLEVMDFGKASAKDLENNEEYLIVPSASSNSLTEGQSITRANAVYTAAETNPLIDKKEATEYYLKTIKLDNYSDFIVEPKPAQPDPMMEMQAALLNSQKQLLDMQAQNIAKDNQRKDLQAIHDANMDNIKAENDTLEARVGALETMVDIKAKDDDLKADKEELKDLSKKTLTLNDLEGGIKATKEPKV